MTGSGRVWTAGATLVVLCAAATASAQSVTVQLSARQIADDDDLQATFTFDGEGDGQLPDLSREWTVRGTSRGMNTRIINGRVYQERTESLVLTPKSSGRLTIGPAKLVDRRGRVIAQSKPVMVMVRGVEALKPSEAASPQRLLEDNMLLVAELERDTYYVGEPFMATWVLYVRRGVRIRAPEISELTLPPGVQRTDVLQGKFAEEQPGKHFFGQKYARVPVMREIWTVLRPEQIRIPTVKVVIGVPGIGFRGQPKRLRTPPLLLDIVPVPTAGRPAAYREGTIGQFQLSATVEPDEEHGRALLEVVVSGIGALDTVDPPPIAGVTGAQLRRLPGDEQDQINPTNQGPMGQRVFQYLLTPERAGTVFVPTIELVYFDPTARDGRGSFEVAKTEPLTFHSAKGAPRDGRDPTGAGADELHPIETESELETVELTPLYETWWYLTLLGLPFALFLGLEARAIAERRRNATSGRARSRRALTSARKRLAALQKSGKSGGEPGSEDPWSEIAKILRDYVSDRKEVALLGLTNDSMRAALRASAGYSDELVERLVAELEACDFARFAPKAGPGDQLADTLKRCEELLTALEKHGDA